MWSRCRRVQGEEGEGEGEGEREGEGEGEGEEKEEEGCARTRAEFDSCHKRRGVAVHVHWLGIFCVSFSAVLQSCNWRSMPGWWRLLLVGRRGHGDRRFCRRGQSGTTTASRKRRLRRPKLPGCRLAKDTTRFMRWTGEVASRRIRPLPRYHGVGTSHTDDRSPGPFIVRAAGALDLIHRTGGHGMPPRVHVLFAQFSLFGLRSVSEQRQNSRSTHLCLIGRTQMMSLCCLFRLRWSVVSAVPVPSPLRRTLYFVSCVRLSRNAHPHQFELSRLCIAFSVAECLVAHGPEMRFMCLYFLHVRSCDAHELFFLWICVHFFETRRLSVVAAASQMWSGVSSCKLAPARPSFGLAGRRSRTSCGNSLTTSTPSSFWPPNQEQ